MSDRLTSLEVTEQMNRFDDLLIKCNLVKAGKILMMISVTTDGGVYNDYNFVSAYLSRNNVGHAYIHPIKGKSYNALFTQAAYNKFVETI